MSRARLIILYLLTASLTSLAAYATHPDCNGFIPDIKRFCKDPFTLCESAAEEAHCLTGDTPSQIIPGCIYTEYGNPTHCDSFNLPTECNRTIDCTWEPIPGICKEGEPNAAPTSTTHFYSDPKCLFPGI